MTQTKSPAPTVFGAQLTDHILVQHFRDGEWEAPRIQAAERLSLVPQTRALHYAQSVFEGLKAHRQPDGSVGLFRPQENVARLARSCERMALPKPPGTLLESLRELVHADREFVPPNPASLYVRPFVFASDEDLIAGPGNQATLMVLLSPVAPFFGEAAGLRLRTETEFVRAWPGGTGAVKFAGNYAASMAAQHRARAEGYHEVVWLDALERTYVEETGAMNLFLVHEGHVLTAPAGDTVLPGITRASLIQLAQDAGYEVSEERVPLEPEVWAGMQEVFSSGTAVGCLPIASIDHLGKQLFQAGESPVQSLLAERLTDIKEGRTEDPHAWRFSCSG